MPKKKKHIILGVTGSIAAYKSADMIRRLQEKDCRVSVFMSREAEQFITPLTLASLSGEKVYRNMFDEQNNAWEMSHIQLAKEADGLLIAPATANTIGKLACGLADDLITCLALAIRKPILIAPAMNTDMHDNHIVQENCQKLKKAGMRFIHPIKGKLACGTYGDGHLADVDTIVKEVLSALR